MATRLALCNCTDATNKNPWRISMNRSRLLAPSLKFLVAANLALLITSAFAQTPEEDLARKVDQLADELARVKAQLKARQDQRAAPVAPAPAAGAPASAPETAAARPTEPATVLFSYGEINYNRPTKATEDTQFDMRRFV